MNVPEWKNVYVVGFPRSGTTWLVRLLCDLLDSPGKPFMSSVQPDYSHCQNGKGHYLIQKSHIPAYHSIYQHMRETGKIIFIQRDPRDVAVSLMFYRNLPPTPESLRDVILTMTAKRQEDAVIPNETIDYKRFVLSYMALLSNWETGYESLHQIPETELQLIHLAITGHSIDPAKIRESYERQKFENVRKQFPEGLRKGIVGDWKNHFLRSHGELITERLGSLLMLDQGYIMSQEWWKELPV